MAVYGQIMTAIDPDSGQLVEVPIDPNNTYVVQDPGQLLSGGQMQVGGVVQAGKSLLKPELAQHLIQPVGFRNSLSRGGFTQSIVDPRMSQAVQRGNRVLSRKPIGPQGMQILGNHQGGLIQQSAALAPTASGLLSLGTRYTPSSGSTLGPPQNAGGMLTGTVSQSGMITGVQGGQMFTQSTMLSERDAGYRLAAAMTGASSRGRPRGRRPLRGQFPVVPIDMVRQLGIEQQVILQPAAPVAMRNKAILCRPLSVSRKTQAGVQSREIECQASTDDEEIGMTEKLTKTSTAIAVDDDDEEEDAMMVEPEFVEPTEKPTIDAKKELDGIDTDDSDIECEMPKTVSSASVNTTQTDEVITLHLGTQTHDMKEEDHNNKDKTKKEDHGEDIITKEKIVYIPFPIPVPIYVPVPVYLYARPVPYAVPFPLPCVLPLPLIFNDDKRKLESKPVTDEDVDIKTSVEAKLEQAPVSVDSTIEVARSVHKRPLPRESLQPTTTPSTYSSSQTSTAIGTSAKRQRTVAKPTEELSSTTRPSSTIVNDTNYHLKFSYGINAWRHWVTHFVPRQTIPLKNLHTELLDVADEDLNLALSRFVHEVRKPNNETYVADSIFYLCLGIQEYLNENGRSVNLFGNTEFVRFAKALDTVLADFEPRISPEGLLICRIEEEHLWEARQLGSQTPHILLFTLLYYITKQFCLRSGENHCQLSFTNFQVRHEAGIDTIYYVPQSASTIGGTTTAYPMFVNDEEPSRCPVKLYRLYAKHCPSEVVAQGGPLYLSPLPADQLSSTLWYSTVASSVSDLQVMLNRIKMVKEIQEAFMNSQAD